MQIELIETIKVGNVLGESVVWDSRTQTVWWTDIESRLLYCYDPINKKCSHYETPERIGSFAFTTDFGWLIVAFESGFAYFNPHKCLTNWIVKPVEKSSKIRFNDGRVDRQGRFWAGTMVEGQGDQDEKGGLYRLNQNGSITCVLEGLLVSNSLCWSTDSTKMYFADSHLRRIDMFDFDADKGTVSNQSIFATMPENIFPDGSIIDAEGYLWNAQWGGGRIVRYANDGTIDQILEMPVSQPTCIAFGGPDLSWIFISTAKAELEETQLQEQPQAGDLFVYKTDTKGVAERLVAHTICCNKGSEQ